MTRKTTRFDPSSRGGLEFACRALEPLKADPAAAAIFSDIDGTISAIADRPDKAVVSDEAKRILTYLNDRYGFVCLVTGRDVKTACSMLSNDRLSYIGSHGLERCLKGSCEYASKAEAYLSIIPKITEEFRRVLGDDILVERKRFAIGLHYRNSPDPEGARRRILDLVEPILDGAGLRWMQARSAIELRPDIPVDKGSAIQDVVGRILPRSVAYVGDDTTDLSAFRALDDLACGGLYSVKVAVNSVETPDELIASADAVVNGVSDVLELFRWLAE